jgi:hypothetical protein
LDTRKRKQSETGENYAVRNFVTFTIRQLRRRVSEEATDGSKTPVMDVIGFLCVSLYRSRVHLHDFLGSRLA